MSYHDITFERPEHRAACELWTMVRDVCRGSDAIKRKGSVYLPMLDPTDKSARNRKRNEDYRARAVFYTITGNTKIGLLGMAFRKDPTFSAPEKLGYLVDNADGAGTSIYQQSQSVLENVLEAGRHGLYVDYAEDGERAIILSYQAENIINWRTERINGRNHLVLVVLRECVEIPDGYGYKDLIQYRELALERGRFVCRVWRRSGETRSGPYEISSEYYPRPKGEQYWDEIPFTFVGAQNNDETIDESPLAALAEINLGHYRNSADYEDSVFFCGQIQPWISGLDTLWRDNLEKQKVKVGSRSPLLLPKEGSFGYAQAQPNMLAKEAMDSKRDYMIALGARLIEQNGSTKTATQASGEQSASTSVLGICVSNVSEAYSRVANWCSRYMGQKQNAKYAVNQEFIARVADSGMISAIVSAWQTGALRDTDMVRVLQRLDIIDPADNPNDVIDALHNREPVMLGGNHANS
ncbi:DUF4055 domain-containing protein [Cronobacter turicensis]|nr:DUF4055 domain-containing protein [Cronobacter turicensis]EKY3213506.1 DUF4055 domain-containing protein [Cronobacter turicensis]EKY3216351.1 DUF4055 domain-containing protein [Cronobacter turicensis]